MTKTISITVTRAFLHQGRAHPVGSELTVEPVLAAELVTMGKAVKTPPRPAPARESKAADRKAADKE